MPSEVKSFVQLFARSLKVGKHGKHGASRSYEYIITRCDKISHEFIYDMIGLLMIT